LADIQSRGKTFHIRIHNHEEIEDLPLPQLLDAARE